MAQIYCGNNQNDPKLISGTHQVGTNYECLRRGIGVGYHLPFDSTYLNPHVPIDQRRFYCGNLPAVPHDYFAVGSPSKCLAIGVGIGKAQRALLGLSNGVYFIRYILPYLLFVIGVGVLFIILYYTKPEFVTKKNNNGKVDIDWDKFIPYYLLFCMILSAVLWLIWKRVIRI